MLSGFSIKNTPGSAIGLNGRNEPTMNINGDVYVQDATALVIEAYVVIPIQELTLAADVTLNSYSLTVTSATGVVVGNYITFQYLTKAFQSRIIDVTGNVITLDSPIDYAYPIIGTYLRESKNNLNVDGGTTAVSAVFKPRPGVAWDIYSVNSTLLSSTAMDDSTFGGITALTKGIVFRKVSTESGRSIFNVKSNSDFSIQGAIEYSDKAPSGFYGLKFHKNFKEENGVAIRLDGDKNEMLELIIQDNLSSLTSFKVLIKGHVVED